MCGRFALYIDQADLNDYFQIDTSIQFHPSYNIAPTDTAPVIFELSENAYSSSQMRWGLIPSWIKSKEELKSPLINARADTILDKPSFKKSFQQRRCLIPANGFYEWRHENGVKQPYFFQHKDQSLLAFAGIWDKWIDQDTTIDSFTIITGEPNVLISPYHDRMPVIIHPSNYATWLSHKTDTEAAHKLLTPYDASVMQCFRVTRQMNTPRFNTPECIIPI